MVRAILRTYAAAFSGLPRDAWLLCAVMLINRAGTMVLPFISLYLTQERGISVADTGRTLSLYGLGSLIGAYLGGWGSDRIGADRTILISLAGSGVAFLWLGYQREPWLIAVGVLVLSCVAESFRPAVMASLGERTPARLRVRSFALLRLAANLGIGIGPAVGGILALYSYLWLFVVDAVTSWAAAAILVLLLRPARVDAADEAADAGRSRRSPWTDVPFLLLLALVSVLAISFFQVWTTLPIYFREVYRLRENTIGALLALNAALIVLFEMVLIHWVERRNRMLLIGLGSLLVCWGFALMPFGRSLGWAATTVVVWTAGEMLALPLLNAVVADRAGPANRGSYMGLYTAAYSLAFLVAPALGTYIYQQVGPDALWWGIGILGFPLLAGAVGLTRAFGPKNGSSRDAL